MTIDLFLQGVLRGVVPLIIMSTIAFILKRQNKASEAKGTFYSALIVFFVSFATVIYNIDQWSLFKQTSLHFLIMSITIYPILLISEWFPTKTIKDRSIVFCYFLFTGVILWSLFFLLNEIIQFLRSIYSFF
ncbi:DUF3021 family protein [Enterococcus gilvus]|uniref:DUF3021 family protein n=1 Tax=Enterococcus gilvus TaxID=160453 RepID=UPI003D6A160E